MLKRLAFTVLSLACFAPVLAADPLWTSFEYGSATPTLTCSPLSACLVSLQAGEAIRNTFLADSAAWEVEMGSVGEAVPVLAIKPHRCGTSSNLFVTTSQRVYGFILDSPACDPATLKASPPQLLRFSYPADFAHAWGAPPLPSPAPGLATEATSLDKLNFAYAISRGRKAIEPLRVFDDGRRTFIVLRPEDLRGEAPAVFIYGADGKLEAVNFTPPGPGGSTYVVDRVVERLALVSGPKDNQRCLLIRQGGK